MVDTSAASMKDQTKINAGAPVTQEEENAYVLASIASTCSSTILFGKMVR